MNGYLKEYNTIEEELKHLKNSLSEYPKGAIRRRRIKGKEYSYLQYREGKQVKSTYIRANELADISKMKVPKDPYSVDVLNYPITLFGGQEWFLSGLSSHYSLVLPCAAIGMLLE